ncbi:MAG: hypothetical protein HZB16_17420 [Armatimonadetes bacterium]|nr:hypothetical protein [Armatimonadota bacterium]
MRRVVVLLSGSLWALGALAQPIPSPVAPTAPTAPPKVTTPSAPTTPAGDTKPAPTGDEKPAQRRAIIRALEPNSVVKTGRDRSVVARGKLQLILPDDDVIAYCDAIDYSGETAGIATIQGNLRMLSGTITEKDGTTTIEKPENEVTGLIGWVFTKEKRAVVDGDLAPKTEGKVVVIHTPKEQPKPDADRIEKARWEPTIVRSDRLTFWYRKGDRKALCQAKLPNVNITFAQKNQRGVAGRATYFEVTKEQGDTGDILDLEGGVQVSNDDGESVEAGAARIFIDQETSQWFDVGKVVVNVGEGADKGGEPNKPPAQPETKPGEPAPPAPPTSPAEPTKPPETPATK